MLRMENANVTGLLTRKERIMKQEIESRQALEVSLTTLTTEKSILQSEIQKIQQRLETVEEALSTETALRAKADAEYTALRTQVNQSSEKSRADLAALRAGIQTLKRDRKEDARTMQLMAGELDRLKSAYAAERETATEIQEEMGSARERQRVAFERAIRGLRKGLEEQALENQENVLRTGEALAELRALNGKIRAVDPDLR
jgi:chromosome segregation ATPase